MRVVPRQAEAGNVSLKKIAHAYHLVDTARTEAEHQAAHIAMVAAFPSIAEAYPCSCGDCLRARWNKEEKTRP